MNATAAEVLDEKRRKIAAEMQVPREAETTLSTEDRSVDEELRLKTIVEGLELFREILKGRECAIFSSTARFLNGKEHGIKEFTRDLPGDLDIAVPNERELRLIQEKLVKIPGVTFDNGGEPRVMRGGDTKVLSGSIRMNMDGKVIKYPFEIFSNSGVATPELLRKSTEIAGLKVLTFEALQNQYLKNFEIEARIEKSVEEIRSFLNHSDISTLLSSEIQRWKAAVRNMDEHTALPEVEKILDKIGLGLEDLLVFYELESQLSRGQLSAEERQTLLVEITALLSGGLKSNPSKRQHSVETISAVRSMRLDTVRPKKDVTKGPDKPIATNNAA